MIVVLLNTVTVIISDEMSLLFNSLGYENRTLKSPGSTQFKIVKSLHTPAYFSTFPTKFDFALVGFWIIFLD
jgi:hypothetical protein